MDITREHITSIFDDIEQNDHLCRIRFYETHTSLIFSLDEREQQYFCWQYINSLFELGKHEHILTEIDSVIEYVFLNDINYLPIGTFEDLLFKKASCYYSTLQYDQAISTSEQLIGIDPHNKLYQSLAIKSHFSAFNVRSAGVRLTAILLIFSSSIINVITWLLSSQDKSSSFWYTFLLIASPCLLALLILGSAHGYSYYRATKGIRQLARIKKQKKSL